MKIGIDGVVLRGRAAGTLRYLEQLLTSASAADSANDYVLFADGAVFPPDTIPQQRNFTFQHFSPNRFLPRVLQQQFYRDWSARGKLDLLHSAAFVPPLAFDGVAIMTLFDLVFLLYPRTKKWTGLVWWRLMWKQGIKKSRYVIVLSESTKRDLSSHLPSAAHKIRVIYPCTRAIFKPNSRAKALTAKYHLPDKYILYVGTLEPRKNIANLVRAFAIAKRNGAREHALVITGERGWHYRDIFQTVEQLGMQKQVIFTGYIPDEDLSALYSAADLFVYLSQYEGFGFPILEAMACGTPVLASNTSSLPEIAGDAGILVSPNDVEHAATEIVRVLSDHDLRDVMSRRGLERAIFFSRERFARETLEVYNQATR